MLASGSTIRSTELWEMSRSCQRATSSSPLDQVAAQHPGQAAEALGEDRVALVGHGRAALLARLERLLDLAHLAAGHEPDLSGDGLDGGADRGARPQVLGVAVAGHHLGGRHRGEPQGAAHVVLDPRVDVRVGAHRARQLAHRHPRPGRLEPLPVAIGLQGPEGELGPEGGGLGVHAVGATHDRRVDTRCGPVLARPHQPARGDDEQVGGPGQGGAQRGVDHVRRGEAVVDPGSLGLADGVLDDVDEGGHVVVGLPLALGHRLDEGGVDDRGAAAARFGCVERNLADLGPAVGGQQLDLEPAGQAGLVGEELGHGRGRVAGDHRAAVPAEAGTDRAMSVRWWAPSHSMAATPS